MESAFSPIPTRASGIIVGTGDGVMVGVGEGVMLGEGIKLGVAVGPKISAGLRLQALSSRAELHNPRRSFLKFIGLLIMGKGGVVKLKRAFVG